MAKQRSRDEPRSPPDEEAARPDPEWLLGPLPYPTAIEIERRFRERLRQRWGAAGSPEAQVIVEGAEIRVEVDLPGIDEAHVEHRLEAGVLRIRVRPVERK